MRFLLTVVVLCCLTGFVSALCPAGCKCKNRYVSCRKVKLSVFPSSFPGDTLTIDMANNDFKVLRNFSFRSTPYLRTLHLDHNGIRRIEIDAFKGAREIKYLFLRNNLLGSDKNYSFVNSLSVLRNLHHLYLTGNNFKKIPAVRLPAMTKLNLDDNDITDGDFPKSFSQCRSLQSVVLSSNAITFLNSQSFKYLESLPILNLDYEKNDIRDIDPQAFHPIATTIRTLTLDRNKLTGSTLGRLIHSIGSAGANLNMLSVQFNAVSVLDKKSFEDVAHSSLFYLRLDGNDIHKIFPTAFSPLVESVRNLTMTKCGLSNQLRFVKFRAMDSLKFLNLSLNRIVEVPTSLPKNVEVIDLRQNRLTVIPSGAFSQCQHLMHLDLRENRISTIAENAFIYSSSIQTLDLAENRLSTIDGKGLFGLAGLRNLDLSQQASGLRLDDFVLKGLSLLQSLNLRDNALADSLGSDTLRPFVDLRNLEDLDLRENELKSIGDKVFTGLTGLRTLRLSLNKLVHWKAAFDHFSARLTHLDISRNRLRFISVTPGAPLNGLHAVMGNLAFFDAAYNPYNCSCPLHPFIAKVRAMGSVVKELDNMRCQTPQTNLQDSIVTVEVGGRCTEKPSIFPEKPPTITKPQRPATPASTPRTASTSVQPKTTPPVAKRTPQSTPKPSAAPRKVTTSHARKQNYSGRSRPPHASRATKAKHSGQQNVLSISIPIVAFIVLVVGVSVLIYRKRRHTQSPIHNIHQKYTHLQSDDDGRTGNLRLRDDEVSLLTDQNVEIRWTNNDTTSGNQFPILSTPIPDVIRRLPNANEARIDAYQNPCLQNGVSSGHSSNLYQPRSIYDTTNGPQILGHQWNIEAGGQPRDGSGRLPQYTNLAFEDNDDLVTLPTEGKVTEVAESTPEKPEFKDMGSTMEMPVENAEAADQTPEAAAQNAEAVDQTPEAAAQNAEAADQTPEAAAQNAEAADQTPVAAAHNAEAADRVVENTAGTTTSPEADFQDEDEGDEEETPDELDMLCLCSKHDSEFVVKELVTPLRAGRYSPVICVLCTHVDADRIRMLLSASRYLLIVNSEKLVEDPQATKLLGLCLEEMRKSNRRPGIIITPIVVFGDEEDHPLLATLADSVEKGKFSRIVWCRALPRVDRAFVKKVEEVLCS